MNFHRLISEQFKNETRTPEAMTSVLLKSFPFFAVILFGFAASKTQLIDPRGIKGLTSFVMFLALPALLFSKLAANASDMLVHNLFIVAYALAVIVMFSATAIIGTILFRSTTSHATLFGLSGTYGNIGFLGIPLLSALIGDWIAVPLALILTFDLALLVPLASIILQFNRPEQSQTEINLSATMTNLVKNPLIIAIIAGSVIGLTGITLPAAVLDLSNLLSQAAGPCAMFVVGAALAGNRTGSYPWEALYMTAMKLLGFPAVVWGMLGLFHIQPNWRMAATMAAAMPVAAVLTVVAEDNDILPGQTSMAILISTLLSVLTVSIGLTFI